ncbi:TP0733 family outer membrane beta-barrel protein [Treponema pallidum]|uniref:TP0733 family outer membrane beta-barrel protein n=1 Tax=Treponema pallidum TaxID=160 RepID=UPI00244ED1BF|nr:hypothetical protein [Treponema pallidum]WGK72189.1 hypothetical protein TPE7SN_0733 [Treponema pallidum subsp. pertenue]WGK73161.1 hypothetical protein TPE18NC_0733 [Treponema pallidum subsp. pertenue]WGK76081.1 hypothetical protein TPE24SN_0733 [Treponema pallidum subsp. pertenue]WGK77053.1 hypothetical protein TPE32LM_0733 [Treponema pallidum subsp. pertenue]WGK78027.1 hypothetical protein TPE34LM_0733 [Treponema pallidum subsp. pertenue]
MSRTFRAWQCVGALCALSPLLPAYSSEGVREVPPSQSPQVVVAYEPIRPGDQLLKIGIVAGCQLYIAGGDGTNGSSGSGTNGNGNGKLLGGGGFHLGYEYFFTKNFSLGGQVSFECYRTTGSNYYFSVPITVNPTYTFAVGRWRIPLSLGVGLNIQSYLSKKAPGLIAEASAGLYYQYTPDWSIGGIVAYTQLGDIAKSATSSRAVGLATIDFGVRYHF